jgi:hypothetical protein
MNFNILPSTPKSSKSPVPFKLYGQNLITVRHCGRLETFVALLHTAPQATASVSLSSHYVSHQVLTLADIKMTPRHHETHIRCSPHSCNYPHVVLAALNWPPPPWPSSKAYCVSPPTREQTMCPQRHWEPERRAVTSRETPKGKKKSVFGLPGCRLRQRFLIS